MRRIVFEQFGDPGEILSLRDAPRPTPGPGDALVRIRARSINPSDLYMVRGYYGVLPTLPATPGQDAVGIVEELGAGADALRTGQRVVLANWVVPLERLADAGTWQEYVVLPVEGLLPVPDSVPDQTATQFFANFLAAWVMTREELALDRGQWLVQTASASMVGRFVTQLGRMHGFQTINVVHRPERIADLRAAGAEHVICSADQVLDARIRELVGDAGVPAALDAVCGRTGTQIFNVLGPRGVMLVYGLLAGKNLAIDSGLLLFNNATIRGFWLPRWLRQTVEAERNRVLDSAMQAIAKGGISVPIEAEYPLDRFKEAVRHADRFGRRGKVLLIS